MPVADEANDFTLFIESFGSGIGKSNNIASIIGHPKYKQAKPISAIATVLKLTIEDTYAMLVQGFRIGSSFTPP